MDKIGEMLITIKNAGRASKASVVLPYSNLRHAVAECLSKQNYVGTIAKKTDKKNKPVLEISISYEGRLPKVTNVERISKPSRRIYIKAKEIRPVKNGAGLLVVSTPKGVLTGDEARKELVGGEALFKIW
ncbi:MAG: 30S ribosomal protein S8 [Candidatus Paceibacterota bacterium]